MRTNGVVELLVAVVINDLREGRGPSELCMREAGRVKK